MDFHSLLRFKNCDIESFALAQYTLLSLYIFFINFNLCKATCMGERRDFDWKT